MHYLDIQELQQVFLCFMFYYQLVNIAKLNWDRVFKVVASLFTGNLSDSNLGYPRKVVFLFNFAILVLSVFDRRQDIFCWLCQKELICQENHRSAHDIKRKNCCFLSLSEEIILIHMTTRFVKTVNGFAVTPPSLFDNNHAIRQKKNRISFDQSWTDPFAKLFYIPLLFFFFFLLNWPCGLLIDFVGRNVV